MSETPTTQEAVEPATQPATPATEGIAGLLAAAVEQTIAQLGPNEFAELVSRVRPPDEAPQQPTPAQPRADRVPPRIPSEPTEQQQRDAERYSSVAYPASWGFQPEGSN